VHKCGPQRSSYELCGPPVEQIWPVLCQDMTNTQEFTGVKSAPETSCVLGIPQIMDIHPVYNNTINNILKFVFCFKQITLYLNFQEELNNKIYEISRYAL
jgi:hypothetical protein